MLMRNPNSRMGIPWWKTLGFFCVVLLLFTGLVQAVHTHSWGEMQHADCALCITAHASFASATPAHGVAVIFVTVGRVASDQPLSRHRLIQTSLFNRPPPAQPAFS